MLSRFKYFIILLSISYSYSQQIETRLIPKDDSNPIWAFASSIIKDFENQGESVLLQQLAKYPEGFKRMFKNILLLKAAEANNTKVVQYLLDLGAEFDVQYFSWNLTKIPEDGILHISARLGHESVAKAIINRRADHVHCITKIPQDLVKIIINYEDIPNFLNLVNKRELSKENGSLFPIEVASKNQKYTVFKTLFDAGSILTQQIITQADKDNSILEILLGNVRAVVTTFDYYQKPNAQIPLIIAFIRFTNNIEAVKKLLDKGADVNARQIDLDIGSKSLGANALMCAVDLKKHDIIKLLIDHDADPYVFSKFKVTFNIPGSLPQDVEYTPLSKAVENVDAESVKCLLSIINIDIQGKNSWITYPLEFAITWYTPPRHLSTIGTLETRNQIINLLKNAQAKMKTKSI